MAAKGEVGATVTIKRVYEAAAAADGLRILIDRLWPRGIKKDRIDRWLKEVAPSTELRRWYNHDPEKFAEFRHRYQQELQKEPGKQALEQLRQTCREAGERQQRVTLLFSAKDAELSNARVLRDLLNSALSKGQ